jgi:hypothetical protein
MLATLTNPGRPLSSGLTLIISSNALPPGKMARLDLINRQIILHPDATAQCLADAIAYDREQSLLGLRHRLRLVAADPGHSAPHQKTRMRAA